MRRSAIFFASICLAPLSQADVNPEVIGNIRVEALSNSVVRIEFKGPHGFEDRPTFHVVSRNWSGIPLERSESGDNILLKTSTYTVQVPKHAKDLSGIKILDLAGKTVYEGFTHTSNSEWLPSPGDHIKAWAFRDGPRIIPAPQGLTASNEPGELSATSGWDLTNDAPDVYVFVPNSDYRRLRTDFLKLTGPAEMPPLYMFGFIDSRWYAYSEKTALERIEQYRRRQIPLDLLVLDTDWRIGGSDGYIPDTNYLPDLPRFFKEAHAKNVRTMFNDHPEPKAEGALDPIEMKYRTDNLSKVLNEGLDVWWYDRNWFTSLHEPLPGLRKEVWGMRLYHDVTQETRPNSRPTIMANVDGIDNGNLNHAPDVAAHKYPVQWTGDTSPTWGSLQRAVQNVLTSGTLGVNSYVHEDLGGHTGMPTPELYTRYLEYGSLGPIMRVHCTKNLDHAPWIFGPEAEKIATDYIKLRYRLLPLLYARAHQATVTGEPIVRRLDLQYPSQKEARRLDQFLIGSDLLCAPIVKDTSLLDLSKNLFHTPSGTPGLKAEYFANQELKGVPTLVRTDPNLNFNWGAGSPDPSIPSDHFSARWTGKLGPIPGHKPIRLSVTADDGVRVYLDDKLVVDAWKPEDAVTTTLKAPLQPGSIHSIKVEYYEDTGDALCELRANGGPSAVGRRSVWVPPGTWTDLWSGKRIIGPQTIQISSPLAQMPLYVRDGAIIPIAPPLQYTGEKPWSPLTVDAYPSREPSEFTLYEDDGKSNGYKSGAFRLTTMRSQFVGKSLKFHIGAAQGAYSGSISNRAWKVRIHFPGFGLFGPTTQTHSIAPREVFLDGKLIPSRMYLPKTIEMPLTGIGGDPQNNVLEVEIPSSSVSKTHSIEIR